MNATKAAAHRAGVLYFLFSIVAIIGEFLIPSSMVPGDAAATARNIMAGEFYYRIDIFTGFVVLILFVFLIVSLHRLLQGVNKGLAMLMLLLVSVGIAVSVGNLLNKFVPLVLLSGADYLSVFSKPQLEALALTALRIHGSGAAVSMAFWGLWLFPFGLLVIKSDFIPRIFGFMLLVAGFAYLASSITSMVFPEFKPVASRFLMPLYFGEIPIIFWLLIKGVRAPRTQTVAR